MTKRIASMSFTVKEKLHEELGGVSFEQCIEFFDADGNKIVDDEELKKTDVECAEPSLLCGRQV